MKRVLKIQAVVVGLFMIMAFSVADARGRQASTADLSKDKAKLTEKIRHEVNDARNDIADLREKTVKKGVSDAPLKRVEGQVDVLENEIAKVDQATEANWEAIEKDVKNTMDDLHRSIRTAKKEIAAAD